MKKKQNIIVNKSAVQEINPSETKSDNIVQTPTLINRISNFSKSNPLIILIISLSFAFLLIMIGLLASSEQGLEWKNSIQIANAYVKTAITDTIKTEKTKNFKKGEEQLVKLVGEAPTEPFGHLSIGLLYLVTERHDSSIRELRQALTLDNGKTNTSKFASKLLINVMINKANSQINNKDFAAAEKSINEASNIDREPNAELYGMKGILYYNQNKYDSSVVWFRAAYDMSPTNQNFKRNYTTALISKANSDLQAEKYSEALIGFQSAGQFLPKNPDLLNQIGIVNLKMKKFDDAEICFKNALKINPGHAGAKMNLSLIKK
ncbi:MAG: tetratricopeptide repeat protein [Candidatus Kapabacteria bacterium]|nr:tetratricopeptide repeat protein [Candidatus Kapabacteria bacterium]